MFTRKWNKGVCTPIEAKDIEAAAAFKLTHPGNLCVGSCNRSRPWARAKIFSILKQLYRLSAATAAFIHPPMLCCVFVYLPLSISTHAAQSSFCSRGWHANRGEKELPQHLCHRYSHILPQCATTEAPLSHHTEEWLCICICVFLGKNIIYHFLNFY